MGMVVEVFFYSTLTGTAENRDGGFRLSSKMSRIALNGDCFQGFVDIGGVRMTFVP